MKKTLFLLTLAFGLLTGTGCAQTKPAPKAKYTVKTVPTAVDNPHLFQSIIDNYKGKVVVVDFWATWCAPCRAAMQQVDLLKEKYARQTDLVWLYLTGETSPLDAWKEMIPGIAGDHYRLTKDQWTYLCKEQFGIPGIPAYTILKRDGTPSYSNLTEGGYIGNDAFDAEIQKALR